MLQEAETRSKSALSAIRSRLAGSQTEDSWAQWSPEEEEDVPEGKGRPSSSPLTANAHLQHTALPELEETNVDPAVLKTQRTLLLIVREMVQTERDYVRALEYIIEVSFWHRSGFEILTPTLILLGRTTYQSCCERTFPRRCVANGM